MRYKQLLFSASINPFSVCRHQNLKSGDTLIINDMNSFNESRSYVDKLPIHFSDRDSVLYSHSHFSEIIAFFTALQKEENEFKRIESYNLFKKINFVDVSTLQHGDTIVYRDRENPNNVAKVSIIDSVVFIHNLPAVANSHFFNNARVVADGENPKEYFLTPEMGMHLYQLSNPNIVDIFNRGAL